MRLIRHASAWVDPANITAPTADGRIDAVVGAILFTSRIHPNSGHRTHHPPARRQSDYARPSGRREQVESTCEQ